MVLVWNLAAKYAVSTCMAAALWLIPRSCSPVQLRAGARILAASDRYADC
jgi:hypothetical protein